MSCWSASTDPRLFSAAAAPDSIAGVEEHLPGSLERRLRPGGNALVEVAPPFEQARPRDQEPRPGLLRAVQPALDRGELAREVAERRRRLGLGQVDARVGALGRAAQVRNRRQRLGAVPSRGLCRRQQQAVFDVVREESPERAVDLDRLAGIALDLVEPPLDLEAILPRQRRGGVERLLSGGTGAAVIAERRPGRGERGLNHRVRRFERGGFLEERLRPDGIEQAQPGQPFGVEAGRLETLREGGARRRCRRRAALLQAEPAAQLTPGLGHHGEEVRLIADTGHPHRLLALMQHPHVDAQRSRRRRAARDERAEHEIVGGERRAQPLGGGGAGRPAARKAQIGDRPGDDVGRHDAQLAAPGQLGRQHLGQGRRQPVIGELARQVRKPGDGNRRPDGYPRRRLRRIRCRGRRNPQPRRSGGHRDRCRQQRRDAGGRAMAAHQSRSAVAPGVASRPHRLRRQIPPHVVGQIGGGRVAERGRLAQRLEDDRVERSGQAALQRLGRLLPGLADPFRQQRFARPAGPGDGFRTGHDRARPLRIPVADEARHLGRRARGEAVRMVAGEQLVEEQAERVDVGGLGDGLAENLLRAGVLRRHRPRQRRQGRIAVHTGIEDFRNPEIEELGLAVRGHEDVAGLEIAMDDVVVVRVLDGVEDAQTEPEAFDRVQPVLVGIQVDRHALDVLHHEVRQPFGRGPAVEEPGDVRMTERREDLALVPEPPDDQRGVHAAADHLERDAMLELVVGTARQVDGAHAAAAETPFDRIRTERAAEVRVVVSGAVGWLGDVEPRQHGAVDEPAGAGVGRQQRLDLAAQLGITRAGGVEQRPAVVRRLLQSESEHFFDPGPARHGEVRSYCRTGPCPGRAGAGIRGGGRPEGRPSGRTGRRAYSDRSAWMTSTRAARAAGISEASRAAAKSSAAAPTIGRTPGMRTSCR